MTNHDDCGLCQTEKFSGTIQKMDYSIGEMIHLKDVILKINEIIDFVNKEAVNGKSM